MALQQIDSLSGGQKSRVAFAVLCGHNPNFLVLGKFLLKILSGIKFIQQSESFYCQLNPCEFEILDFSKVGLARMSSHRVFKSLIRYMSATSYRSLIVSSSAVLSISPLVMKLSIILITSGFTSFMLTTPVAFSSMSVCNILLKTGEYEAKMIFWYSYSFGPTLILMSEGNSFLGFSGLTKDLFLTNLNILIYQLSLNNWAEHWYVSLNWAEQNFQYFSPQNIFKTIFFSINILSLTEVLYNFHFRRTYKSSWYRDYWGSGLSACQIQRRGYSCQPRPKTDHYGLPGKRLEKNFKYIQIFKIFIQELWVCSKGKVWSMEGGLPEYIKLVEKEMVLN